MFIVEYMNNNPQIGDEPLDIEDLVNIGRRFGPYVSAMVFSSIFHMFFFFLSEMHVYSKSTLLTLALLSC